MTSVDFLHQFRIFSREGKTQPASRNEVRRWLESGAVRANGQQLRIEDAVDFPVFSLVLFPKGNRITLK